MARLALLGLVIAVFILLVRVFFPAKKEKTADTKEMVQDPNCETYVPKAEAIERSVQGKNHYFCSQKCAEEFSRKNA